MHWRAAAAANSLAMPAPTHVLGNLDHRLLGLLCGQDRRRDREREFAANEISAEEIAERWGQLCAEIEVALSQLTQAQADGTFDHPERGPVTGQDILIIVARHMGQAELTFGLSHVQPLR
jgi:hypothetical protein